MPATKSRFVALCQQLLVLGVVFAVLVPAASVLNLDVVRTTPDGSLPQGSTALGALAAHVPDGSVEPEVREVGLTTADEAPRQALTRPGTPAGRTVTAPRAVAGQATETPGEEAGVSVITSEPQPVTGYGAIGITWARGEGDEHATEAEHDHAAHSSLQVRTRSGGVWSQWQPVEYHAEHAPSAESPEADTARPGTDAVFVGEVDQVQVRAELPTAELPADMRLVVVDPGTPAATRLEQPRIDTGGGAAERSDAEVETHEGAAVLQAAAYAPQPQIFSRAQWGANESLRDKGSLRYGTVAGGFVHHTVNANDYSAEQVPAIIRSIYAYHTRSRGWSDIGYNFLVDRFGRIWEGRYGGVDRPVVGAHTSGYNDYAFAMSAIGNFDQVQPTAEMLAAYGRLMGWKLSLHGVDSLAPSVQIGRSRFPAISGHRDAGSTACPGRHLYAQLANIRHQAKQAQSASSPQVLGADLVGSAHPDLVARQKGTGRVFLLPTGGTTNFAAARSAGASTGRSIPSPDLNGDGRGDLYLIARNGRGGVRAGNGAGGFGRATAITRRPVFAGRDLVVAAGDLNGDGRNDLVGRYAATGKLTVYLNRGKGAMRGRWLRSRVWRGYDLLVGSGDVTGDGRADLLGRDRAGGLHVHHGLGNGTFGKRTRAGAGWGAYDTILGAGDVSGDGRPDLLVRQASTGKGWIRLGRGNGTFGAALGPFPRFKRLGTILGAANVVGNEKADVVSVKRGTLAVAANAGTTDLGAPIATNLNLSGYDLVLKAGDWNRDGRGDLLARAGNDLHLFLGQGNAQFAGPTAVGGGFAGVTLLAAVGDVSGDGWPDLVGQVNGSMHLFKGQGTGALQPGVVAHPGIAAEQQIPAGRWDADATPDTLFRSGGSLVLYTGGGPAGVSNPRTVSTGLAAYDAVVGVSSLRLGSHADLLVRGRHDGLLYVLFGRANGALMSPRPIGEGLDGYDLIG